MTTLAQNLFTQTRELPAAERDAFLQNACGDDAELHLEVQRLLVDAERADSFFGDQDGATLGAEEFKETYAEKEGDVVGPFKLRQQIGEGGFGSAEKLSMRSAANVSQQLRRFDRVKKQSKLSPEMRGFLKDAWGSTI